jgi:outer membrane cobalamin receptor
MKLNLASLAILVASMSLNAQTPTDTPTQTGRPYPAAETAQDTLPAIDLIPVKISAEPHLVTKVFSDVDIQLRNLSSSQDMLRMVPGLFIAQHAGGGKAEQIFLRGFDIDHGTDIAITTDGIPVNMVSHAHGQGYADLHFLIPETIDRVHFGKGPYHNHHGNLATAGYVGFNTLNKLPENTLSFELGQNNLYRGLGMINLLNRQDGSVSQNAYLAAEVFSTDGYFDSPQDLGRQSFFGKFNTSIGRSSYLAASASSSYGKWNASGQIPIRSIERGDIGYFGAIDDTEGGRTSRSNLNIQLTTSLNQGVTLKNQLFATDYHFDLYSNFTFFLNDEVNGDQIRQRENRLMTGYKSSLSKEHTLLGKPATIETGLQFRYDRSNDNELSHTQGKSTLVERLAYGDIREINASLFVTETWTFSSRFTLQTGLRFDHFDFGYRDNIAGTPLDFAQDNVLSPKLNAYYQLNETMQLSVNAGIGFHSNDTRVVLAQEAVQTLPRATGMDAGLLWKPTKTVIFSLTAWHLGLDQEFVYVGDEAIVEPSGRTSRMGIELSSRWQLAEWLFADVDLNYTRARALDAPTGQNYIPLAPVLSSIGGLTLTTNKRWTSSLRYRFLGDRAANEDNSLIATGYTVFDVLIRYRAKRYEFGINIDNLLNTRWREAQFETTSRLRHESVPVTEIHFTPGTPFALRAHVGYKF